MRQLIQPELTHIHGGNPAFFAAGSVISFLTSAGLSDSKHSLWGSLGLGTTAGVALIAVNFAANPAGPAYNIVYSFALSFLSSAVGCGYSYLKKWA